MSRAECSRNFFFLWPDRPCTLVSTAQRIPFSVFFIVDRRSLHAHRSECHAQYDKSATSRRTSHTKAIVIRSLTRSRAISLRRAAEGGPQTQDASSNRSNGVEELFSRMDGQMLEFSATTRRRLLSSGNFAQSIEHFFRADRMRMRVFREFHGATHKGARELSTR